MRLMDDDDEWELRRREQEPFPTAASPPLKMTSLRVANGDPVYLNEKTLSHGAKRNEWVAVIQPKFAAFKKTDSQQNLWAFESREFDSPP